MNSAVHDGSNIMAPALAGGLYLVIGLPGIILIDLITFGGAIATLVWVNVPQPLATAGFKATPDCYHSFLVCP
jgi:hypothetical protein